MILELPEVRASTIGDLEKLDTGDFQLGKYAEGGIPEYWIVDRHPDDDRDALVHIHHLVRGGEGGVFRLDRTIPLSKLEQE